MSLQKNAESLETQLDSEKLWNGLVGLASSALLTKGAQWDAIPWRVEALLVDTTRFWHFYENLQIFGKVEIILQMNTHYLDSTINISLYLKKLHIHLTI